MSIFKKNLEKNAVKKALNEIQINLENNYKDLAIKAYNDAAALIETYRADKKLNDKMLCAKSVRRNEDYYEDDNFMLYRKRRMLSYASPHKERKGHQ